jgi:DNA polymerase-3 subunit epsilon
MMKPLVSLDFESTGTDVVRDRITQIGAVKVDYERGGCEVFETLVNPGMPIPPVVIEKIGITNEMVAEAPLFAAVALPLLEFIGDADLLGFNIWQFDLPLLSEELNRCGHLFDWQNRRVIDAGVVFKKIEERTLSAFVKRYAGRELVNAHNATADAHGVLEGWRGLLAEREDLRKMSLDEQAAFATFEPRVDLAGKLSRNADGDVIYNFGQRTKGVRVKDDIGFAHWILDRDFPTDTKRVLMAILQDVEDDFRAGNDEADDEEGEPF